MGTLYATAYTGPAKWGRWISQACILLTIVFSNFANAVSNNSTNTTTISPSTQVPNISVYSCEWEDLKFPITIGPAIACALAVTLGGFELFVGFKYLRTSLFLTGLGGGAILTYFICVEKSNLSTVYILLITGAVAIFVGILCTTVVFCGQFSCGLAAGFCISMAFLLALSRLLPVYNTISIPLGVMVTITVIFAGIAVWWKRFLIVTTSVFGGALIAFALDYFIEDFWLIRYSLKKIFLVTVYGEPCLVSWIILGLWPLLTIIGLLVQFLKTAKKPPKPKKGERRFHANRDRYTDGNIMLAEI